jgi:hypothetical protein
MSIESAGIPVPEKKPDVIESINELKKTISISGNPLDWDEYVDEILRKVKDGTYLLKGKDGTEGAVVKVDRTASDGNFVVQLTAGDDGTWLKRTFG